MSDICHNCGKELKYGSVFCTFCGASVGRPADIGKKCEKKKGSIGKIIVLIMILTTIVLSVFIIVKLWNDGEYVSGLEEKIEVKTNDDLDVLDDISDKKVNKSKDEIKGFYSSTTMTEETDELSLSEVESLSAIEEVTPQEKDVSSTEEIVPTEETVPTVDNLPVNIEVEVDIERTIKDIRKKYNDVNDQKNEGKLIVEGNGGIDKYFDNGSLRIIEVKKGTGNKDYRRFYYFDDNGLFFAYYEGKDASRLYFEGNRLIRWRYSPNANDPQNAENHDDRSENGFLDWENRIINDCEELMS